MDQNTRILAIYAAAFAAAGAVSYARGRRGGELMGDVFLYGAVGGTGLNVVYWLASQQGIIANPHSHMGTLSKEAVNYLAQINTDQLYSHFKEDGVKLAFVPSNPNMVVQDKV